MTLPFFGLTISKAYPFVGTLGLAAAYSGTQSASNTSVIFTAKRDGTWAITFDVGDIPSGAPTSGNWSSNPTSTIGDNFEVRYTISNQVNSPTTSNGASSYTAITSNRAVSVNKNGANASADILIEFREIGTVTPVLTASTNFAANGAP